MSAVPAAIAPRVGQLIRLLGSDKDGEALAACRALGRTLASVGQDFHALADAVERSEPAASVHHEYNAIDPRAPAEARWLSTYHMARLTEKERDFVRTMATCGRPATERQAAWLRSIVERMPGGQRRRA
jgi:hypothetical protein